MIYIIYKLYMIYMIYMICLIYIMIYMFEEWNLVDGNLNWDRTRIGAVLRRSLNGCFSSSAETFTLKRLLLARSAHSTAIVATGWFQED